jgi:hypothetical protein
VSDDLGGDFSLSSRFKPNPQKYLRKSIEGRLAAGSSRLGLVESEVQEIQRSRVDGDDCVFSTIQDAFATTMLFSVNVGALMVTLGPLAR